MSEESPIDTASGEALIQAAGLNKVYGPTRAVDDVSFTVERGEILGFLGPNGAGKSTTLKIITGYLAADSGTVTVCGHEVAEACLEARRKIGYLPESLPLYAEMQVLEYLRFIAESRGLTAALARDRIDKVVEQLGLTRMLRRHTGSLSKGYRQRVGLAQAILHDPEVLILDEPTNGLDPHQIIEIRALIAELARDKAVVFSTHILQEISAICTRIMIIRDGRLIANGSPEQLAAEADQPRWELLIQGADLSAAPLSELGLGECMGQQDGRYSFAGSDGDPDFAQVANAITRHGGTLLELRRPQRSLEQVYLKLTDRKGA